MARAAGGGAPPGGGPRLRNVAAGCLVAIAAAGMVSGCATFPQRLQAPEVRVSTLRLVRVAPPVAEIEVGLALANPNAVDLAVDALEATIAIEGEQVAEARLRGPVVVPAKASTAVVLDTRADLAASLRVVTRALSSLTGALRYEVTGVVVQAGGTRWPFSRRGEIPGGRIGGARG